MSAGYEKSRAQELLQHASAIRGLARRLVGDAEADDLVQDTWVAALVNVPTVDRPLRPWLGTVLRNFARRSLRRSAVRPATEASASGSLPADDPAEVCEGIEAAQLLTEEVGRLAEPYRSAVYLHYYQGVALVDVARRFGVPPATVRSHLRRGIDRLRQRLDGRFGQERGTWCALLVPLIRSKAAVAKAVAAPAIATTGFLTMNASLKIGAALAAAMLAYVGLTMGGVLPDPLSPADEADTRVEAALLPTARGPEPEVEELAAVAAPEQERQAIEASRSAAPEAPAMNAGLSAVQAVITNASGAGLAGAELRAVGRDEQATSVGGGVVRLELELDGKDGSVLIEAAADGFASYSERVQVSRGETVDLGTLALDPGGVIHGTVVDEQGRLIEGARITVAQPGESLIDMESQRYTRAERGALAAASVPPCAFTGPEGTFTLSGLKQGHVRLWAESKGTIPDYSQPIEVSARAVEPEVQLVLETITRHNSIAGVVVDPEGSPVPYAELRYLHSSSALHTSFRTSKQAEADGTFRFVVGEGSVLSITADDPEKRYGPASARNLQPGADDLVLRLLGGTENRLVALGENGEQLERFRFSILTADEHEETLQDGESEHGSARFRLPEQEYRVWVTAPLHQVAIVGPLAPGATPASLEVQLEAVPGIRGRVLANGEPVTGAKVRLHRLVPEDTRWEHRGYRCWLIPGPVSETASGDGGAFVLTARRADDYVVHVERSGFALAEWGPFTLGADLSHEVLEIELGPGGAIAGRVTLPNGEDPTGTLVAIHRGDGFPQTTRVESNGTYRFERLTPGAWYVGVRSQGDPEYMNRTSPATNAYDAEVTWNCDVVAGRATIHDLHVPDPREFVLAGRIRFEGVSGATISATLVPKGGDFFQGGTEHVTPDSEGRFELGTGEEGDYRLVLHHAADLVDWLILDDVHLGPGPEPWELEIETGSVEITGIDPAAFDQDLPPFGVRWRGPGGVLLLCVFAPSQDAFTLDALPVGLLDLVRPDMARILEPIQWDSGREFRVVRGETVRVEGLQGE